MSGKGSVLFDQGFNAVYCDQDAPGLLGCLSEETLLEFARAFLDGGDLHFTKCLEIARDSGFHDFNMNIGNEGRKVPFNVVLKRIDIGTSWVIAASFTVLRELKTEVLLSYDPTLGSDDDIVNEVKGYASLLQALNNISTKLIETEPDNFSHVISDSLRVIANTVDADRAYIWENFESEGMYYCRQLYDWARPGTSHFPKELMHGLNYDDMPLFKNSVYNNKPINRIVSEIEEADAGFLKSRGIVSILVIPIIYRGQPWGFIGFDDCHRERIFSAASEQVLQSAGILMVSTILRNTTTQRLIDTWIELLGHEKFLRAVNQVARYLLESNEDDFSVILDLSLSTLGNCVAADRVSFWRNTTENGEMRSCRVAAWRSDRANAIPVVEGLVDFDEVVSDWYDVHRDVNVNINDSNDVIKNAAIFGDCTSTLILPIHLHGNFWGFMSFLRDNTDYVYSDVEKSILRSGGMLIASALIRDETWESLVEARESALASSHSKTEFLSRMSHEIRTPMNAIIGMTTLAKKSDNLDRVRNYLETVDSSSRQLLNIINDVLDMSKIDANKLEIDNREFGFEGMIRHVYNVIQVKLSEKKLNFHLDLPKTFTRRVISDELRLSQVLINLMSNAIKFTPEYGSITLKVAETQIDKDISKIRMEVQDTGIGIEEDKIAAVFQSFEQADGGITRQYGGTGLGLAICKRIIALMGGQIWAESKLGKGSSFIMELEVAWGREYENNIDKLQLRPGFRVLAVDDDPGVLEYLTIALDQYAIVCETAANGEEAIELIKKNAVENKQYDIALVDWFMPGMNGGETAKEIRRITKDSVIIIMISSADWNEIKEEAMAAGVNHYIAKPLLSSDVYRMLLRLKGMFADIKPVENTEGYDWGWARILLAEDIEINREIVAGILEESGIQIDNAENGSQAVEMYRSNPDKYQLILMDVQMPVMDGLTAARTIRELNIPGCTEIPIIAMTANAFKEDEEASFRAGMNGHLAKPINIPDIYKTLSSILDGNISEQTGSQV